MPFSLRLILIVGALLTFSYFIRGIRKNRVKINHSIFWIVFGLILLVLAFVPRVIYWLSAQMGIESPANLVYLAIIFLLVLKLFTTTLRLSRLSEQVAALTQAIAIRELEEQEQQSHPAEQEETL